MANEISDTESVTSSASSSGGSATECLKAPSGAKSKVLKLLLLVVMKISLPSQSVLHTKCHINM